MHRQVVFVINEERDWGQKGIIKGVKNQMIMVSGADSVEYLQRVRAIFEEKICPKAKKAVNAQLDTFEFVLNLKHKKELMAVGGLSRPSGPGLSNPLG